MIVSGRVLAGWARTSSLALMVGVALVACGGEDEGSISDNNLDTRPEATERGVIAGASPAIGTPARGRLPQDLNSDRVAIEDGDLDPDRFEAQVEIPYVLTVEGDGEAHTLAIEDLVTETEIAAEGETQVQVNIPPGSEGDKAILLDGEEAGTLAVLGAGGVPEAGA